MKYRYVFTLALICFAFISFSQSIDIEQLKGLKIRNIGPAGMSGRVTTIDVDLQNPDRILVGTASGGVWLSESGGIRWEPIFDKEAVQSIGALAINQQNPSEIWVGTGEGNPRNSLNSGMGIYKSLDGGRSWTCMGLENTRLIHRIIIHRDDPNTVIVGALGSAWGPNPERGVYKTTDGGKTWRQVLYLNEETGVADLVVDPSNPNKLIAAMWQFGRQPHTFNSGGPHSGLYISFDGGETWERRTDKDGLPKGDLGRIGLAVAPSKPNIIYALVEAEKNGLYKSTDGGFNWSLVSDKNIGNRPFYYADIFVDPKNENRIFNLWSSVSLSEDGGKTFSNLLPFYPYSGVHPDHHAFWIHPDRPSYLIEGNDGGLNISRNGGKDWQFVENLPLAQFYHIDYDMDIPYNVMGGMQDNGSWIGPAYHWQRGGIRNHEWQEVYFGDGFDVAVVPNQSRFGYAMSQGGNLGYFDKWTGEVKSVRPVHPEGTTLRFNWNAALALDPFLDCGVYYGSQFLHYSQDCGQSWTLLSPDLTTNDTTKQKQHLSGGLTIDNTQAENFTTIVSIAPSPMEKGVLWVGTDDGNLQLTRDGGKSWNNLAGKLKDCPAGSWFTQIVASTHSPGEAFIVVNNYRRNDWRPMVYHTTNYGQSFQRIVREEQVSGYALSIVQDPVAANLLWLGTDHGLYLSQDSGQNWNKWTNDFPSVSTHDLKIHPREHDLIVGTFGRAAWILDDIRPIRNIAQTQGKVLEQALHLFPAPDAYLVSYRSIDGNRFIADAIFDGTNRPADARLTVWHRQETETTKETKKKPKAKVEVYNEANELIRNFSVGLDTGMNRFTWDLRRNGVAFPSRRAVDPDDDPPRGPAVLPGTYKVVCSFKDHQDSTLVRVLDDPRAVRSLEALTAQQQRIQAFYQLVEKASAGFTRLVEAEKTIALVNDQLVNAPDSLQKAIKKEGKQLQDSIDVLQKLYMLPDDLKGIQRTSENINSFLYQTNNYLQDWDGSQASQMAELMEKKARTSVAEALTRINSFFQTDWARYQERVESNRASLFKPYEAIKLE